MKKKVLIVDDSLFMRTMLKDLLSKQYAIVEADSAAAAVRQVTNERPDLVLLDIVTPEGEKAGVEVLRKLHTTHPNAPVVMVTAVGQNAVMDECRKLGVKDYIIKPFDEEQVVKTVEKYLS